MRTPDELVDSSLAVVDAEATLLHDLATPLLVAKMNVALLEEYLPPLLEALIRTGLAREYLPPDEKVLNALLAAPALVGNNLSIVQTKVKCLGEALFPAELDSVEELFDEPTVGSLPKVITSVLLVDDEPIHRDIAECLLSPLYQVDYASNGIEAMVLCKLNRYDLILMDLQMPKMNGEQATLELRQGINAESLVVGLTDMPIGAKRTELLAKGFNDFLEKPLKLQRLDTLLQLHLQCVS